ncbi:HEAT repeat domain-containing protein [Acinetobacter sp. MB5]|uniref:HEAT repeat domain-containing protein n=1 Tax=Acinetobacter sp. MB5 TaxID=2069438 RepID=UPI000DD0CC93|nr:HEAT repeat domain-containing protein [Acinetobacter sp. MB5]
MIFDQTHFIIILTWLITISLALVCQLIFGISYMKMRSHQKLVKKSKYVKLTEDYLDLPIHQITAKKIKNSDFPIFISSWSLKFNSSDADTQQKLIVVANVLDISNRCLKTLKKSQSFVHHKNTREICLLIHTLGNIYYSNKNSETIQTDIQSFVKNKMDIISFEACIALLKIDSKKYYPLVLDEIISREKWNNQELKHLMQFFNTPTAVVMIFNKIKNHNHLNEKRIIKIASRTNHLSDYSSYILNNMQDFSVDSICLAIRNINNIEDFKLIEHLKEESSWVYHINIIHAIVKLNYFSEENFNFLLKCLSSSNWWVRHRSAEAIIKNYNSDENLVNFLIKLIDDQFSKESLQVAFNKNKLHQNLRIQ